MVEDRGLRSKRTHRVAQQEYWQAAVPTTKIRSELRHVGDQASKPRRAEVAQMTVGGASMASVVDRLHQEAGCIQRTGEAVVACSMLGKSVGDLDQADWLPADIRPTVSADVGAVGDGSEAGVRGSGVHSAILTWSRRAELQAGATGAIALDRLVTACQPPASYARQQFGRSRCRGLASRPSDSPTSPPRRGSRPGLASPGAHRHWPAQPQGPHPVSFALTRRGGDGVALPCDQRPDSQVIAGWLESRPSDRAQG